MLRTKLLVGWIVLAVVPVVCVLLGIWHDSEHWSQTAAVTTVIVSGLGICLVYNWGNDEMDTK